MPEIEYGTAVALISKSETMKGRVQRPPRFGKASVLWVRRLRASSVRLEALRPIADDELVAFLDQQDTLYREAWERLDGDGDLSSCSITPPAEQPEFVKRFIRTGKMGLE